MPRTASFGFAAAAALATIAAFVLQGQGNTLGFLAAVIGASWSAGIAAISFDRRAGVILTSLVAFAVSMYLGHHHVDLQAQAICNVNEVFNCDLVNRSQWSELRGVPIAYIGAAFYLGAALVGLLAKKGSASFAHTPHLIALGGALSVAYSLFLVWASLQVGAWCLLCVNLYGLNALLLVAGLLWTRASGVPLGEGVRAVLFAKQEKSLTVLGVLLVVGMIGGRAANKPVTAPSASGGGGGAAEAAGPTVWVGPPSVTLDGTEPVMGNPNGRITIVEFADFECPFCGVVAPDLKDLAAASPEVRVVFKHYPLDNACNANIKRVFHKEACKAAAATECAHQQGRFWELSRLMFLNQEALGGGGIEFMASQVGLDKPTFDACLAAPETMAAVRDDIAHATAIGIDGTPSIFVLGLYGTSWVKVRTPGDIAELLQRAASGQPLPMPVPEPHDH